MGSKKNKKLNIRLPADQFTIRTAKNEDLGFILNSWLKSYRDSIFSQSIKDYNYYPYQEERIKGILNAEGSAALIVCDPEDEDHILGYVVFNAFGPMLHYIYIKRHFRGFGLAKYLLEGVKAHWGEYKDQPVICTHIPKGAWRTVSRKFKLDYNPYVISVSKGKED